MAIEAIIDTNVLYAGLYSSLGASYQVLQALEQGRLRSVLSTTLVFEYEEVLKRKTDVLGLTEQDIEALLDDLCHRSDHRVIHFLWRPCLSDPKDDHILELAVASEPPLSQRTMSNILKTRPRLVSASSPPSQLLEELR